MMVSKIDQLFVDLPEDRVQRLEMLTTITSEVREKIAKIWAATLNAFLVTQAPETDEQKRAIAEWVSRSLEQLGLAIRYQGRPCNILVNKDGHKRRTRFLIRSKGDSRPLIAKTELADLLPLELMEAPQRREALREWHERGRPRAAKSKNSDK